MNQLGNYVIVGARKHENGDGNLSGAAYVFKRVDGTWQQQQHLVPYVQGPDAGHGDLFGGSVSMDRLGNFAIVGASLHDADEPYTESNRGSAYVFKRVGNTWVPEGNRLNATDGADGDEFGFSVSISGVYAVVGAPGDDDMGESSGSAYVFKRVGDTWVQQAKLAASDGAVGHRFGHSVAISGEYAIVGAKDVGNKLGSAYVFKRDGEMWNQQQTLTISDGAAGDRTGHSVDITPIYAVVGAIGHDDMGKSSGSAYVFKREGTSWRETRILRASDGEAGDEFGFSVSITSINGFGAFVGAMGNSGTAYSFNMRFFAPGNPTYTP